MDEQLKRRIIGIVVLVIIMLIIAPFIFRGTKQQVQEPNLPTTVPTPPVQPVVKPIAAHQVQIPPAVIAPVKSVKLPKMTTAIEAPVVTANSLAVTTKKTEPQIKPTAKPLPKLKAKAALHARWTIQVASLSEGHHADLLVKKLTAKKFAAHKKTVKIRNKQIYRVFIKPNQTWQNAIKVLVELRKHFKINAFLVRD